MVKVVLWGGLRNKAGGKTEFEIAASTIREIFLQLSKDFPDLEAELEHNVSVAVDGTVYRDTLFVPVHQASEVVILPKLQGG
jgi:molybdopterin converting factor small subunit